MSSSPISRSSSSLTRACDITFSIKICIFTIGEIKYAFFISMPCKACMAKNAPILFATIVVDVWLLRIGLNAAQIPLSPPAGCEPRNQIPARRYLQKAVENEPLLARFRLYRVCTRLCFSWFSLFATAKI